MVPVRDRRRGAGAGQKRTGSDNHLRDKENENINFIWKQGKEVCKQFLQKRLFFPGI